MNSQHQSTFQPGKKKKSFPRIAEGMHRNPFPPVPDVNFAAYVLEEIAEKRNNVAIVDSETDDARTFSFLVENVPRVAGGLKAAGVGLGDVVLMVSPNHVDFPLVMLSVVYCGATYASVNPEFTPGGLCKVMRQCGNRWVMCHPNVLDKIEETMSRLPPETIQQVWLIGGEGEQHRATLSQLRTTSPIDPVNKEEGLSVPDTVAMMFSSSGTTGELKVVKFSHLSFFNLAFGERESSALLRVSKTDPHPKLLLVIPMTHGYATKMMLLNLLAGGTTVILPQFSPEKYFNTVERFKITSTSLLAPDVYDISKSPLLLKYDISSVVTFTCAGCSLATETVKAFKEKTGRDIIQPYGLTEASHVSTNGGEQGFKKGSVGMIKDFVKVKVVDLETGDMLGEYDQGEVCIQSPFSMMGYADNPEATCQMVDSQGWLHTGDIGYFDEDNFLFLTDRLKDIINYEGHLVSPAQIENILCGHEEVQEAAVIGVPDVKSVEAPRAYVVLAPGSHLQPKELQDYVASRATPDERLTGGVEIMDFLPRNHMGKILKKKLKQDFIAVHVRSEVAECE